MRSLLQNARTVDHVRFNLTLVRHAETHANADGVIQGLIDTELSNIGYLQSQALGRYLQYHRFSHIFSSDLKRASETVLQIRSLNQVSACEIQYETSLRERMYGIAQGRTRQWLRELAKESGVPYINFTPPGAETTSQVRGRAVVFFQNLCQQLLKEFGTKSSKATAKTTNIEQPLGSLTKEERGQVASRSVSSENLSSIQETRRHSHLQRSSSTGTLHINVNNAIVRSNSCQSSIDSAFDLSSLSSDQQSISSSLSLSSRNSSFDKQRSLMKSFLHSPYKNDFSDVDVLVVSHGAVIRELIKYFACDLQTDIGQHFDTIQEIAPNTSITRFEVTYSVHDDSSFSPNLELIDYHSKTHLIQANNDEYNLDVVNKCSL